MESKYASAARDAYILIDVLTSISKDLMEEITAQRDLANAESEDLVVIFSLLDTIDIITSNQQIQNHEVAKEKTIVVDNNVKSWHINTDDLLLRRILMNMLKNALVASKPDETVTIGCTIKPDRVKLWVNNCKEMPEDIKAQVLQRSFSTKGSGRGLGTYSIKLLGERYLKGTVDFTSNSTEGTTFFVELPLKIY